MRSTSVEEAFVRGWTNLIARLDGPMHLRFFLQPTIAALLAIRAGVRDAREGRAPFLADMKRRDRRRGRLREAWSDVGTVFLVAVVLDSVYQLRAHQGIYLFELLLTAALLALVPYGLVRGPAERIAGALIAARSKRSRSAHGQ